MADAQSEVGRRKRRYGGGSVVEDIEERRASEI